MDSYIEATEGCEYSNNYDDLLYMHSHRYDNLYSHLHGNFSMGIVAVNLEVLKTKVINVLYISEDLERGKGAWPSLELPAEGFNVVEVDVRIP